MRRQFQLAEEDVNSVTALGLEWETLKEGDARWVILPEYNIAPGYNHRKVSAALRIPPGYPDDQIDMIYFYPALSLASGKPIRSLSFLQLDGKSYQQWSRHRTGANPWRPGLDNLCTHLLLANSWLERELP